MNSAINGKFFFQFKKQSTAGNLISFDHNGLVYFPQPLVNDERKQFMLHDDHIMNNIWPYNRSVAFVSFQKLNTYRHQRVDGLNWQTTNVSIQST
jgi:hypothetical protein